MTIYFGCTGTLIDGEGNVRPYADFVLKELANEGHRMFLMRTDKDSGRSNALSQTGLFRHFEGVLTPEGSAPAPDYIIDADSQRFESDTPGYQVPYFNQYALLDDDELLEAYRQIRRIDGKPGPPPRQNVDDWSSGKVKP